MPREFSPPRHRNMDIFGEPRPASAVLGHERTSSEQGHNSFAQQQPFQQQTPHSFRAFQSSPPSAQEQRQTVNGNGSLARPNSQPAGATLQHVIQDDRIGRDANNEGRFGMFRQFGDQARPSEHEVHAARLEAAARQEAGPFERNLPTSQPSGPAMYSPRMTPGGPQRFQPGAFGTPLREEVGGLFRPAFQHYPHPTQMHGVDNGRDAMETRSPQDMRREQHRPSPPLSDISGFDRSRNIFGDRPLTLEAQQHMDALAREEQRRKESEDSQAQRSFLGVSPDLNRKNGRNSPLPQAVQGAQPRHIGPGGDNPGIKSEFGRMFSGLGSGVGSTTPTAGQSVNGTTTPSRLSPARHIEGGDLVRTAVDQLEGGRGGSRGGSRGGKKGRKSRDELVKGDDESVDGRTSPGLSQRGIKRAKTTHPAHHHHHHAHTIHHHHHHHHDPSDSPALHNPSPFNMLRFTPNAASPHQSVANNPAHHHHHHVIAHGHPGHHHHHHAPKAAPPPRKPTTTVSSKLVFDSVAHKPRSHLGSQLYVTDLSLPPAATTPLDAKFDFKSKMRPMLYFEGKENCTYTIRVPRWYLGSSKSADDGALEEICKRRRVWGTDIYSDQSDVVAAAVHAGWIKGDFGEYNEDLHELCDNDSEHGDDAEETKLSLTDRPSRPVKPPRDHDAHITLLILPPLESYASTSQHHIWSRTSDDRDGMSYAIHRIEFVDEGAATRYSERTAEAMKKRLAAEESRRKEAAATLTMFASGGVGSVSVGA